MSDPGPTHQPYGQDPYGQQPGGQPSPYGQSPYGQQPAYGIHYYCRRQFPATQHIVAYGYLHGHEMLPYPLIDSLIVTTDNYYIFF